MRSMFDWAGRRPDIAVGDRKDKLRALGALSGGADQGVPYRIDAGIWNGAGASIETLLELPGSGGGGLPVLGSILPSGFHVLLVAGQVDLVKPIDLVPMIEGEYLLKVQRQPEFKTWHAGNGKNAYRLVLIVLQLVIQGLGLIQGGVLGLVIIPVENGEGFVETPLRPTEMLRKFNDTPRIGPEVASHNDDPGRGELTVLPDCLEVVDRLR